MLPQAVIKLLPEPGPVCRIPHPVSQHTGHLMAPQLKHLLLQGIQDSRSEAAPVRRPVPGHLVSGGGAAGRNEV